MNTQKHEWFEVIFNYASWIECGCGFVAYSEEDFNTHNEETKR